MFVKRLTILKQPNHKSSQRDAEIKKNTKNQYNNQTQPYCLTKSYHHSAPPLHLPALNGCTFKTIC